MRKDYFERLSWKLTYLFLKDNFNSSRLLRGSFNNGWIFRNSENKISRNTYFRQERIHETLNGKITNWIIKKTAQLKSSRKKLKHDLISISQILKREKSSDKIKFKETFKDFKENVKTRQSRIRLLRVRERIRCFDDRYAKMKRSIIWPVYNNIYNNLVRSDKR